MTVYVNFFIHCEDFISVHSQQATRRAAELFARYGVKADFYLTGLVAERMLADAPETIETLKRLKMPISYHADIHAPFPTLPQRVRNLDWDAAVDQAYIQETSHLDPLTGDLSSKNPNQLTLITDLFGKPPIVTIGSVAGYAAQAIRFAQHKLGVPMASTNGSMLGLPLIWHNGMLRGLPGPGSYFYLTDVAGAKPGEREHSTPLEAILTEQIARLPAERDALISFGVHDFSFALTDGWIGCYRDPDSGRFRNPRGLWTSPPLSIENQERIWQVYENLVAFCAHNSLLSVITAEDMLTWVKPLDDTITLLQPDIFTVANQLLDGWAGPGYPPDHAEASENILSLADCFQVMVKTLTCFHRQGVLPEQVEIRELLGPTDTPVGLAIQRGEMRPRQLIDGTVVIEKSAELDALMKDRIPGVINLVGQDQFHLPMFSFGLMPNQLEGHLNPAEFLYLAAQEVLSIFRTGKPGPALLMGSNMFPHYPEMRWVENRFPPFAVIQENYFMQEWLSELQSWTIKPARLKRKE